MSTGKKNPCHTSEVIKYTVGWMIVHLFVLHMTLLVLFTPSPNENMSCEAGMWGWQSCGSVTWQGECDRLPVFQTTRTQLHLWVNINSFFFVFSKSRRGHSLKHEWDLGKQRAASCVQHLHESWVKLKPVSPVLLPGANRCPPPASMAVRCGDIPKSERTQPSVSHMKS